MAVKLVSFADGVYSARREGFITQARQMGVFDDIIVEDFDSLPVQFRSNHGDFLKRAERGFGYWIWKPVIIQSALDKADEDDVIVYLDAGFTLNPNAQARLNEYVAIARSSPHKMLSFQIPEVEQCWTKADLLEHLDVRNAGHITLSGQLASGCILMQKTRKNLELVKKWSEVAVASNYRFSDDSTSLSSNCAGFVEHRHDQSISSIIRKIFGTTITYYEAKPMNNFFANNQDSLPFWATRSKS